MDMKKSSVVRCLTRFLMFSFFPLNNFEIFIAMQSTTIYPNMSLSDKSAPNAARKEGRKVRALYDFEAAEDNELTFFTGEIIHVLDDSDENWWTGYSDRGEGLFPSNFVTTDLNVDVELNHSQNPIVEENSADEALKLKTEFIQIDEMKIDRLLFLLHEANPEDPSQVKILFWEISSKDYASTSTLPHAFI